ncbi:hypertension-related calcium-regulated gene protein, partial [Kipferlia bialata]
GIPIEDFRVVFTGIISIYRSALRTKIHKRLFEEDLRMMDLPQWLCNLLIDKFRTHFKRLASSTRQPPLSQALPEIKGLDWRVGTVVGTDELFKANTPQALLGFRLKDGRTIRISADKERLALLKTRVAESLLQVIALEKQNALKS